MSDHVTSLLKILWPPSQSKRSKIYFHPHTPFTCCFTYYSSLFHTTEPHCTLWHYRKYYRNTLLLQDPYNCCSFCLNILVPSRHLLQLLQIFIQISPFQWVFLLPSYLILQTLHTHTILYLPFLLYLSLQNCSLSIMLSLLFFLFTSIFPTRIQTLWREGIFFPALSPKFRTQLNK